MCIAGSESHILDCESREVTGCPAVTVDCDPGFPLTTRLHQAGAARELGELTGGRAGYPVVDTTGRLGLLCSAGTDLTAVNMICRMLGLKHVIVGPPTSQHNIKGLATSHYLNTRTILVYLIYI